MALQQFSTNLTAYRTWSKEKQPDKPAHIELECDGQPLRTENSKGATWKQIMNKIPDFAKGKDEATLSQRAGLKQEAVRLQLREIKINKRLL
jgi:hypothetical protein